MLYYLVHKTIIALFWQFASNLLIKDLPSRHLHLISSHSSNTNTNDSLLSGLTRYNGQFFMDISSSPSMYTSEPHLAFFPLYPILIRLASFLLQISLPLSAILISSTSFILATLLLYRLTLSFFPSSPTFAYHTCLLFCLNPASIFFMSAYTESLYSLLAFTSMLALQRNNAYLAATTLFMASATRSNGVLNSIFVLAYIIRYEQ